MTLLLVTIVNMQQWHSQIQQAGRAQPGPSYSYL